MRLGSDYISLMYLVELDEVALDAYEWILSTTKYSGIRAVSCCAKKELTFSWVQLKLMPSSFLLVACVHQNRRLKIPRIRLELLPSPT